MYIHEQLDWPQFSWDATLISGTLAEVRHQQGRLLGRMQTLGFDLQAEANLLVLTSDVVKTSAIEGEVLQPQEVRSSLARRLGLDAAGLPKPHRDVEGIVEIMLDATQNFRAKLTKTRLYNWHAALFPTGRKRMTRITVGKWRPAEAGAMQVVSGPLGRERVHFEAPAAERLDREMRKFLQWFNAASPLDPVLKAALAHFWFVTIHPFEDGNGRLARAIADLSLARADDCAARFYSMTSQIEAERESYYRVLELAQRGELDITRWLEWFLDCLGRAIGTAELEIAAVLSQAKLWQAINRQGVNERQKMVINRLLKNFQGPLTNAKYAKLAKCSADTAWRDIRELLECGILKQNPQGGRSTSYRLAEAAELADRPPITP